MMRTKIMLIVAGIIFLIGVLYVGHINEVLKGVIPTLDRAILLVGFVVGLGAVARWIIGFETARLMEKIRGLGR